MDSVWPSHVPEDDLARNGSARCRDPRGPPKPVGTRDAGAKKRAFVLGLALIVSALGGGSLVYIGDHGVFSKTHSGVAEPSTSETARDSVGPTSVVPPSPHVGNIPPYLQDIGVTIRAGKGEGSGILRRTRDGTTWVWTVAHVISDLRKTRQVVDGKTGATRTVVEFDDAKVVKQLIEDGRTVGRLEVDAQVVRYSDADYGEDLALLRIRKKHFADASVKFYQEKELPARGTDLYHCGSLLGEFGASSLTEGVVSQHGRLIDSKIYDQVSTPSFPGSSGGGVFLKSDGRLIGLLVRGTPGGFSLIVPVRRMAAWAKKAQIEWAIHDDVPVPSLEELEKLPIEGDASNP